MTRRNVYSAFGLGYSSPINKLLAKACYNITGIYPVGKRELKKAMLGHELSLLLNYIK